jgi:predicted nucleic-acid-binding Zn-ribbon protein
MNNTPTKSDVCPKCGSSKRERGEIFPKGSLWDIRFKSDIAFDLSLKKKVVALACSSCGFIELYLAEHEGQNLG